MTCRDSELIKKTRYILDSLKNNAQFPSPDPTPDVVEKALQEYILALSNAGGGDRKLVAVKNNKRAELRVLLKDLAAYVTKIGKDDKAVLIGSGFPVSADRSADTKLPPTVEVDTQASGQATTRVKKAARARAYIHQYAPDPLTPETEWKGETSHLNQHTFTGLPSLTRMWFRVIVLTRTGDQLVWDPVSAVIW
jgi:hypothetical protein